MNGAAAVKQQPEQITFAPNFAAWQKSARRALANDLAPENIIWEELGSDQPALAMFDEHETPNDAPDTRFRVPKSFVGISDARGLSSRSKTLGAALSPALAADPRRASLARDRR